MALPAPKRKFLNSAAVFLVYSLVRRLLFALEPEAAHDAALLVLSRFGRSPVTRRLLRRHVAGMIPTVPTSLFGLDVPNPVGLAAGLDKNAVAVDAFMSLGFGWAETGTVTPLPQPGNPKPRMFRLTEQGAIINRMGFNGCGVTRFLDNLERRKTTGVVGINIGKNAATKNEDALQDYVKALAAVYAYADYVVVNISSPNTAGLRDWQQQDRLTALLRPLKTQQQQLQEVHRKHVPLVVKVAPDLDDEAVVALAAVVADAGIDGVIATNTTISRPGLEQHPIAAQAGGLSGRPLAPLAAHVAALLREHLPSSVPIIGCGGIDTPITARQRLDQGSTAIQLYTGLIFKGPRLAADIVRGLDGYNHASATRESHQQQ